MSPIVSTVAGLGKGGTEAAPAVGDTATSGNTAANTARPPATRLAQRAFIVGPALTALLEELLVPFLLIVEPPIRAIGLRANGISVFPLLGTAKRGLRLKLRQPETRRRVGPTRPNA